MKLPKSNAGLIAARIKRFETAYENAVALSIEQALTRLKRWVVTQRSSGPFKLPQLKRMGYPFAKRGYRHMLPENVINVQRGHFRSQWKIRGTAGERIKGHMRGWGRDFVGRLVNASNRMKWLLGTEKMVPRVDLDEIRVKGRELLRERLRQNLKRLLPGAFK